jgi:hypothetical protein
VRLFARSCLVAFLIAGLLNLPALAANDKALGVVIQSQIGHLGTTNLAIGTSVYAGDSLSTDVGGTLRLKVRSGQIYLLSASALMLGQDEQDWVQGTVVRGTAGFSAAPSDKLELLIPAGALRPNGQPAYGQVTLVSPTEMIISAYRGSLVLDNAGELHVIDAGLSYRVTVLPDDQRPEGAGTEQYPEKIKTPKRRHLVLALILLGVLGASAYVIHHEIVESPSRFN